jgi:hypothetical protein
VDGRVPDLGLRRVADWDACGGCLKADDRLGRPALVVLLREDGKLVGDSK